MKKQVINKTYRKVKTILKIKIFNIHIFYFISLIYTLMWIINNPHELYNYLKDSFIYALEWIFLLYLPEIIIHIFDVVTKRFAIGNKIAVKMIKILIIILSYVYFVLLGFLTVVGKSMFE